MARADNQEDGDARGGGADRRRRVARFFAALLLLVVMASGGGAGAVATATATATALSHGPRTQREIALTFDDGVSPANCRRILAELVEQDVPATFFPMAEAIRLDPAFWLLVAAAGDPVGDHTVTHPHMPTLSYTAQLRQMTDSRAVVQTATGRPMLDVFRPPYGEYDATTLAAAAAAGFPTLLTWDTSDRDTSPLGSVAHMLAAAEQGTNGSVVLLHCGPNATPYLLPDVIAFYRRHGFRFVTVAELLGIAWQPGPTAKLTAAQILGGLSPLPPQPRGGLVVGIGGGLPPGASPLALSGSGSPAPITSPSTAPSAATSTASSATPIMTIPASSPSPSSAPEASETPTSPASSLDPGPANLGIGTSTAVVLALGGLAILIALLAATATALRRRRR
jgi:peptidoglycan-N-acetylglucosamine deacetylase